MSESGAEQRYVQEAFDTHWVASLESNVNVFKENLECFLNTNCTNNTNNPRKKVAALSSCAAALHLALVLLGAGRDDEMMCQSFTFCASTNPVAYCGARPVFVDSEKDTLNMSPQLLEEAINDNMAKTNCKPKAFIAVDLYGMPAHWMPSRKSTAMR